MAHAALMCNQEVPAKAGQLQSVAIATEDDLDFIERFFHFSPDGGNGFIELLILACVALAAIAAVWQTRRVPEQSNSRRR